MVACVITAWAWYRAGRHSTRVRVSCWAIILIPVFRMLFYIVHALGICEPRTLNILSSALILQMLITLTAWALAVTNE